jgi:hypothetical protein
VIQPRTRRRIAGLNVVFWSAVTVPGAWVIPTLDEIWFQRLALFLGFVGLVIPAWDVWVSTDVRVNQGD